jgi:hypothetical protein
MLHFEKRDGKISIKRRWTVSHFVTVTDLWIYISAEGLGLEPTFHARNWNARCRIVLRFLSYNGSQVLCHRIILDIPMHDCNSFSLQRHTRFVPHTRRISPKVPLTKLTVTSLYRVSREVLAKLAGHVSWVNLSAINQNTAVRNWTVTEIPTTEISNKEHGYVRKRSTTRCECTRKYS